MSYETRRIQRRELLTTAFHEEFSLMAPHTTTRNVQSLEKAVSVVNNAVTYRRQRNCIRDAALLTARVKSAALNPEVLLEHAIKEQREKRGEEEFKSMQDRYLSATHLLGKIPREEKTNIQLESEMYLNAAAYIAASDAMQDYDSMHVGEIRLPPQTAEKLENMKRQRDEVEYLRRRNESYMSVQDCKVRIRQKLLQISMWEDEISRITTDVQLGKENKGFDWAVDQNNYIRQLQRNIDNETQNISIDQKLLEIKIAESKVLYPDMEFDSFEFS